MTFSREIVELFGFLKTEGFQARNKATNIVSGLSTTHAELFSYNDYEPVKSLAKLMSDEPLTAHDALAALINLSAKMEYVACLANQTFIRDLIVQIILPKNVNADLCCMLLNNLSKFDMFCDILLSQTTQTHMLDNLLELFSKSDSTYNPSANFHFLGGVFANLSCRAGGCQFFMNISTVDSNPRLGKIIIYTEHSDVIRRGGVVATIKNVAYGVASSDKLQLLLEPDLNLIVSVLLPLSGPEDYTDEEMEGMPPELQLLEPTKSRESDAKIRIMLIEILLIFTSTRFGRDYLRAVKAYDVIKKLHLVETDSDIQEKIETLVNMLMRDEETQ